MRGRRRSGGRQLWRWREGDGGIFGLFWKVLFLRANCGGVSVIYVRMIQKRYIPSCNKLWCRGLWVVIRLGGCWRGCGLELKLEQLLASCQSNYDGLMMMDNELFWTNSFWICNGKQWSLRRLWIKNRSMRFWLSSFSSHKLAKICESQRINSNLVSSALFHHNIFTIFDMYFINRVDSMLNVYFFLFGLFVISFALFSAGLGFHQSTCPFVIIQYCFLDVTFLYIIVDTI